MLRTEVKREEMKYKSILSINAMEKKIDNLINSSSNILIIKKRNNKYLIGPVSYKGFPHYKIILKHNNLNTIILMKYRNSILFNLFYWSATLINLFSIFMYLDTDNIKAIVIFSTLILILTIMKLAIHFIVYITTKNFIKTHIL
ncbi:MAG: hypothetical protein FD141_397 [Fusobacteria bacterium]|nr:MAG: hypothetical protein FD141_397 [Fusobacteriota bacterium]KAF0228938.1 MAG: hypothetical protein FD182_1194 [Fusobacteriota bacterium]